MTLKMSGKGSLTDWRWNARPAIVGRRGLSGGLGTPAEELRREANAAAIARINDSIRGTASAQIERYGQAFDALANFGRAIQSGGDFTAQLNAAYDTIETVAGMIPVYGTALRALFAVMQSLTNWLASVIPSMPDSCNTYPKQAAQHYARAKWGLSLTPDEAEARVYRDERLFFIGTVLSRRYATSPYYPAPSCFWIWHDFPMAAPSGAVLEPSVVGSNQRMVDWPDAFLSNTDYTLRLDASGSLEDKQRFLTVATRPWREFPSPVSPASGYRDWYDYLQSHPDNEGSAAAIAKGDQVAEKLLTDGNGEYMGWGYDSSSLGYRSWLSGYFVSVEGLDDETIFGLLRWFSSLPTENLREGTILPTEMMVIPPEDPSVGDGWGWHPGLDFFLRDFIYNNGPYMAYHYSVLLQEYKRRKDAGIWTIRMPGTTMLPLIRRSGPTLSPKLPKKEPESTSWSTGTKVAVGVGAAAVAAGILKLLKVW